MIALGLIVGFSFWAGWLWCDVYRNRPLVLKMVVGYTPYERSIRQFDQDLAEARKRHAPTKDIIAAKAAFVQAELERTTYGASGQFDGDWVAGK